MEVVLKKMKLKLKKVLCLNWDSLSSLINNRAVKSSLVWMVVTPISAKALERVDLINLGFADGPLLLSLPFSWVLFFWAAISFSIASVLFKIWCPLCIQNYKNLMEYKERDFNSTHLKYLFFDGVKKNIKGHLNDVALEHMEDNYINRWAAFAGRGYRFDEGKLVVSEECGCDYGDRVHNIICDNMESSFVALRELFKTDFLIARFLATVFFYIGCVFMTWVVVENMAYVAKYSF